MLRVCPKCSERKRDSSFARGKNLCKLCFNAQHRAWAIVNKDKLLEYNVERYFQAVKRQHGITLDQYHSLAEKQDFLCAICREEPVQRKLDKVDGYVIDHDHKTGKVRGLLCHTCNAGLGYLKDNKTTLQNAINYLNVDAA